MSLLIQHRLTKQECVELARKLRAYAKESLADGLEAWKDDPDMIPGVRADARDVREAARLLRTDGAKAAWEYIGMLDTFVREGIPQDIWDALANDAESRRTGTDDTIANIDWLSYRHRKLSEEREVLDLKIKAIETELDRLRS